MNDAIKTVNTAGVTASLTAAILTSSVIILPCLIVWLLSPAVGKVLAITVILCASVWAAVDSVHLGLREYKSPVAAHPFVLFTALLALWIVVFPAYLVVRSRIRAGQLTKGVNPRERRLLYICIVMWCLPLGLMALASFVARNVNRLQ